MDIQELSLFLPFYNEEKLAEKSIAETFKVLGGLNLRRYEVIAVENGSRDRTLEILKGLKLKYPQLRVMHLEKAGYGRALKAGFEAAKFEWVFFTDSDLQFDLAEISKLIEKVDGYKMAIGYRKGRREGFVRNFNTWGWNFLIRLLFGISVRDVDCAFKLIHRDVLKVILPLKSEGALISAELLVKAHRAGFEWIEVGVSHFPDPAGGSTGAKPSVIVKAFWELLKVRFKEL